MIRRLLDVIRDGRGEPPECHWWRCPNESQIRARAPHLADGDGEWVHYCAYHFGWPALDPLSSWAGKEVERVPGAEWDGKIRLKPDDPTGSVPGEWITLEELRRRHRPQ